MNKNIYDMFRFQDSRVVIGKRGATVNRKVIHRGFICIRPVGRDRIQDPVGGEKK